MKINCTEQKCQYHHGYKLRWRNVCMAYKINQILINYLNGKHNRHTARYFSLKEIKCYAKLVLNVIR